MMIRRERYLQEVLKVLGKPVIKVFSGMRRVGKSTLLQQIQDELLKAGIPADHIISINFELLAFEALKDYRELNRYLEGCMTDNRKYYVFLDEIQEVTGFERLVNSLNASGKTEVFISGSNSKLLSGELATLLTGRYYSMEVLPLSLAELISQQSMDTKGGASEHFLDYIRLGGLPGRLMFDSDRTARNYLLDLYRSILLRDVVERTSIRDVDLLQRFMLYLMHNTAQAFSAGTITGFLRSEGRKFSRETIYNYLEACRNAFLVHGVPRYNIKGKELMKTNEKYFVNDLGLRALFFDNEKDIGQALENIVYLELRRRGYEIFIGKLDDKEVDFVVRDGASTRYIQVAYLLADQSVIEREFGVLERIDDNFPKMVLSMDGVNRSRNGIEHRNIVDFLLE
jgi:predicted AAA+ superfamily ATPase